VKRKRIWKIGLLFAVPLALLAMIALVLERNSWWPRTIKTWAVEPNHLQFSPDGRTLAFNDGGLYICDVASCTQKMELDMAGGLFLEKGSYMTAVSYSAPSLQILSVWDGKTIAVAPKDFDPVGVLADESTLIGWMSDQSVDARQKLFRWNWRSDRVPQPYARLSKKPEGPILLLSDKATLSDGRHFWDLATGKLRFQLEYEQEDEVRDQLSNPSSFMAFREGNTVRILDYRMGKVRGSVAVASSKSDDFKVSPDGTMLAEFEHWTTGKPQINLWDIPNGRLLRQIEVPVSTNSTYSLAFSPDGRTLAVALCSTVKLWRIK